MTSLRIVAVSSLIAAGALLAPHASAAAFVDVLDTPAQMSPLAQRGLLQGVARAGERLVAVGQRGHILVSGDGGTTWKQSPVPVSSDLTAVYFVDARRGWAVGHDGVVLRSDDGGDSWQLQLDGRKANELLLAAMTRKVEAEPSDDAKKQLAEAKRYAEQGADKPFLDVWFADANEGYVVGAYNLIFRTSDGGKSWSSWFDRTDAQRFKALPTPYTGSYFGVVGTKTSVLVFGLRGTVYRSDDAGKTWVKVDAGLPASVVAAERLPSDTVLLADVGGHVVGSEDGGRTFKPLALKQPMPITGLADAGAQRLALVGPRGVAITQFADR
jgi:photosystem II stability/assembly factor-like uncharacterized protein